MRRVLALALMLAPGLAVAESLRVATFDTELARKGPGLLLRDISSGKDAQVAAVVAVIAAVRPDVLVLQGVDWDFDGAALAALAEALGAAGVEYPYTYARRPNTGMASGLDLDGDGRLGGPGDAQGFGSFTGQGGMAVLSRFPVDETGVEDYSALLWRDLPGAELPVRPDGGPFPSEGAQAVQRLSSVGHWVVPVVVGGGPLRLMLFRAGPPVFDGPEDSNGKRNHDEVAFWRLYLDGSFGSAPEGRFVIAGNANIDPFDSDGRHEAIRALLGDPRVQDVEPESAGAVADGGKALATVEWQGVGRLRVDYVLPSRDLEVTGAGVFWPAPGETGRDAALAASRHRLVWVDLRLD